MSFSFDQNLVDRIDSVIRACGFECIELLITTDKTKTMKLYIDHLSNNHLEDSQEEKPVSVEQCAAVSRLLGEQDWFEDAIQGAFTLEVSSPGLDRPLRFARHFKKHLGAKVKVQLKEKFQDRWKGLGVIDAVNEEGTLFLDTELGSWSFPVTAVQKANVVYQWN